MKKVIYTTACIVMMGALTQAQNVSEKNVPVVIPEGWVQDNIRNKEFLAKETLVKADEVGELGNGHILIRAIELDQELASFQEVVDYESKMVSLNRNNTIVVKDLDKITTADTKKSAVVKQVKGSPDAAFQAVAYINDDAQVVSITLASHTQAFFDDHYADFVKVVKSYSKNVVLDNMLTKSEIE